KGQAGPNPGDQDEGQAGPNLDEQDKGQARPNPDVSTQPHPEQMDEGFTTTAYPKVQENLKLTVKEQPLQATATETTTTTTIHPPPPQPQQSTIDSMLMKCIGELKHIMVNLIQDNKHLEERLDSHGARLCTLENLDIPQQPPPPSPPAGPFGTSGSPGAFGSSQVPPPPPLPPSTNQEGQLQGSAAPSYSKINNWAFALASTYSPPLEDSLLAQTRDMARFVDWFYKR
nr:hypothetical protein [Tanacetum cinerariifolium]